MNDVTWLPPGLNPRHNNSFDHMMSLKLTDILYWTMLTKTPSTIRYNWWGLIQKQPTFSIED